MFMVHSRHLFRLTNFVLHEFRGRKLPLLLQGQEQAPWSSSVQQHLLLAVPNQKHQRPSAKAQH
jgi:hypothetical protein